jgi:hypothetical protein
MSENTETAILAGGLFPARAGTAAPPRRSQLHPRRLHRRADTRDPRRSPVRRRPQRRCRPDEPTMNAGQRVARPRSPALLSGAAAALPASGGQAFSCRKTCHRYVRMVEPEAGQSEPTFEYWCNARHDRTTRADRRRRSLQLSPVPAGAQRACRSYRYSGVST